MGNAIELQITLFLLIGIGYLIKKCGIVSDEGQKSITDLVINVVLPLNIITAFINTGTDSSIFDCLQILIVSTVIQIFCVSYGAIVYRNRPDGRKRCLRYGIICSNAGFLGNPIAEGLFGATGLMLASIYLIPQRVMMWSEGLRIFSNETDPLKKVRKVLLHPCVVACVVGAVLMIGKIQLPSVVFLTVSTIGRCNTALSMFVIGMILSRVDLRTIIDKDVIRYTFERLLLIPALVWAGCRIFSVDSMITSLSVILAAMPAGATTSMLAEKYDHDPEFATKMVLFSTLCSIPTLVFWTSVTVSF